MNRNHWKTVLLLPVVSLLVAGCGGNGEKAGKRRALPEDSAEALQKYSIRFDTVVADYYSSGLVGNGLLGASVYKTAGDTLCWELGRTDVTDHRPRYNPADPKDILYTVCRLPIGKLCLPMDGNHSDMTMDLYRAEVSGQSGRMKWRTFTPACENVLVVEWEGMDSLPDPEFRPAVSRSPRAVFPGSPNMPEGYKPNPEPKVYTEGNYHICKQPMTAGGEYTTVWTVAELSGKKRLILSIGYSQERTDTEKDAIRDIERVTGERFAQAGKEHLEWWHDFYARSFASVGEDCFDAFFWSQLYKLGSATRSDRLPIDLMGPWYHDSTPWPAIWWNLNIQLTYSPLFAINHAELVKPLADMLDANVKNLMGNVPEPYRYNSAAVGRMSTYDCVGEIEKEYGLLTWTMLYYWKYCRYTNDTERLKTKFFPLLKLSVNFYRHLLTEGEDGRLHLPVSFSPEYADAADCNFELALLRWGCETLLRTNEEFGLNDSLVPEWNRILEKLTPYPQDEDGMLIGKDVKLRSAHRHYSHLLMFYPLGQLSMDVPENEALARKSIDYWLSYKGFYTGYTYSGASSMYTLMRDGEKARENLKIVFDKYMQPNTLYRESGPVIETPLSVLASYTEMLLTSRDSLILVMPAVPDSWKNIRYRDLLAEGGFEVSAERQDGVVREVRVHSLYGGVCVVESGIPAEDLNVKGARWTEAEKGRIRLEMKKGQTAVLENGKVESRDGKDK